MLEIDDNQYSVAVIVPCWNCAAFIDILIKNLLNQSFRDWRAFFVDDTSTDETSDVIKKYHAIDPRINYILRNRFPKGAQTCRNIGMEVSAGAEYLVFLDADDIIAPYCLEQRVHFMQFHPEIDYASFPLKAFKTDIFDQTYWGFGIQGKQELLPSLLSWKTLQIVVVTNIYRRRRLIETGMVWDEKLLSMQDADFNIQAQTKGLKHVFAGGDIDYFYRQNDTTVSKRIFLKEMFDSHIYLISKETDSIQRAFHSKYNFYLKTYIVNFFELFKNEKKPYLALLSISFVRHQPIFFLKILLFCFIGMRGKRFLFGRHLLYTQQESTQWHSILKQQLSILINNDAHDWHFSKS